MTLKIKGIALAFLATASIPVVLLAPGHASDHADTPDIAANPGADLTDVYVMPSTANPRAVCFLMNVHPLIKPRDKGNVFLDPNVLYQFKIDTNGDYVEDKVIQFKATGTGPTQQVMTTGVVTPSVTGSVSNLEPMLPVSSTFGSTWVPAQTMKAFSGVREDSFFFDLEQFFTILPDRATPITGNSVANPNTPQAGSWRAPGVAKDFLSSNNFNVISMAMEVPRKVLGGGVINVWCTTSKLDHGLWKQMDRLARPAVNEVFATVANNRHQINDEATPTQDAANLANDIQGFMTFPCGRSQAITDVVKAVLVPDVLKVNLASSSAANSLGVETGGATGGTFGGRALGDDVVDLSLGVIFGNTIPALGLAPDDHNEIPSLTSDNVDASGKHFQSTFPYIGKAR